MPEAWGRASVDFPELKLARALVSLVLALPFGTGAVERAFRIIPYQEAHHRAHMQSSTLENIFLATQAPLATDFSKKVPGEGGASVLKPRGDYLPKLCQRFVNNFGSQGVSRKPRKERRDKGGFHSLAKMAKQRLARGAPKPTAAVVREREAALESAMRLSPEERRRAADAAGVPAYRPEEVEAFRTEAMREQLVERQAVAAAEIARQQALPRPAEATAAGLAAPSGSKRGSSGRWVRMGATAGPTPGALLLPSDAAEDLKTIGKRKGFWTATTLSRFLEKRARCEQLGRKGHMVMAASVPRAMRGASGLTAALSGAYLVELAGFRRGVPVGVQYAAGPAKKRRLVATTDAFEESFPGTRAVLEAFAARPGSALQHFTADALVKRVQDAPLGPPKAATHHCLGVTEAEEPVFRPQCGKRVPEAANAVRIPRAFFDWFATVERDAAPPGVWG